MTEIRKMLHIGYALMPEIRKSSELRRAVIAYLEKREQRLKKTRKHAVRAMNEAIRNTFAPTAHLSVRGFSAQEPALETVKNGAEGTASPIVR